MRRLQLCPTQDKGHDLFRTSKRSLIIRGKTQGPYSKCPERLPSHLTKQASSGSHPLHSQDPLHCHQGRRGSPGLLPWRPAPPCPPSVGNDPVLKRPLVCQYQPVPPPRPARAHSTVTHLASVTLSGQAGGRAFWGGGHAGWDTLEYSRPRGSRGGRRSGPPHKAPLGNEAAFHVHGRCGRSALLK